MRPFPTGSNPTANTIGTFAVDAAAAMAMVSKVGSQCQQFGCQRREARAVAMRESPIQDEGSLFAPPELAEPRSKQIGIRVRPVRNAEERDTANDVLLLRDGAPGAEPSGSRRSEQRPTTRHFRTSTMTRGPAGPGGASSGSVQR